MEGRKEMFYLTTHSTHFIYGYGRKEGNVLFNDTLNTFYLRLYGVNNRLWLHMQQKRKKKKKEKKIGYIYKINPHATPQCPVFTEAEALSAIPVFINTDI